MNLPRLTEIGIVQRAHGVNGEIHVNWSNSFDPDEHILESVFLSIDGLPVPFFIESHRSKGHGSSILVLDGITTKQQAHELVACKVLASMKKLDKQDSLSLDNLVGYTVITLQGIQIGAIMNVEDFSGNLVFQITQSDGAPVLIPANPNFILKVDEWSKTITMEIPQGLL